MKKKYKVAMILIVIFKIAMIFSIFELNQIVIITDSQKLFFIQMYEFDSRQAKSVEQISSKQRLTQHLGSLQLIEERRSSQISLAIVGLIISLIAEVVIFLCLRPVA